VALGEAVGVAVLDSVGDMVGLGVTVLVGVISKAACEPQAARRLAMSMGSRILVRVNLRPANFRIVILLLG
jgi:hypothetical protein